MNITEKEVEKCVIIGLSTAKQKAEKLNEYLDELEFLVDTAGAKVVKRFTQNLSMPNSRTYIGSGKLSEVADYIRVAEIDMVVFDDELNPSQLRNIEEAFNRANALEVSFQAGVFTKNIDTALLAVKKLNATAVMVNDHTAFRVDWMPFGGAKASGLGLGGIRNSMDEMSNEKLMVIKSNVL